MRKDYVCNKCNPPQVFQTKQQYGGHSKKHSAPKARGEDDMDEEYKVKIEVKIEEESEQRMIWAITYFPGFVEKVRKPVILDIYSSLYVKLWYWREIGSSN